VFLFIHHKHSKIMNKQALKPSAAHSAGNDLVQGALRAASERGSLHLSVRELSEGAARLTLDLNGVAQSYLVVVKNRLRGREELDAIAGQNHGAELPSCSSRRI
jgi:hypothetical protein